MKIMQEKQHVKLWCDVVHVVKPPAVLVQTRLSLHELHFKEVNYWSWKQVLSQKLLSSNITTIVMKRWSMKHEARYCGHIFPPIDSSFLAFNTGSLPSCNNLLSVFGVTDSVSINSKHGLGFRKTWRIIDFTYSCFPTTFPKIQPEIL